MSKLTDQDADVPGWLEPLCRIPLDFRSGRLSILQLFEHAKPDLTDARFASLVRERLRSDPLLITAWQDYSYDKRTDSGPYMEEGRVGFFDIFEGQGRRSDVRNHKHLAEACVDFIYREAAWVIEDRRVTGPEGVG
jgi:hypothetical protein